MKMPNRKITNATPFKTLSRIPDLTGQSHDAESLLEAANIQEKILDPNVLEFETQPLTVSFLHDGKIRRYTPDLLVQYKDRELPEIEEVKPHKKTQTEEFRQWEAAVRPVLEKTDAAFAIVTDRDLYLEPRLTNLDILFRYLRWPIEEVERREVLSWFHSGPLKLGELRRRAALVKISVGVIFHLLARHELVADINLPFDAELEIRGVKHG
jgi:hypothetical protein